MSESVSKRRLAENEVVFRQYNERVQRGFEEMKKIAKEDNQEHMVVQNDAPLHFLCECSDENCRQRILLSPSRYKEIHKQRDRFVIVCGHETKSIEKIIRQEDDYCIIKKLEMPPETARSLNATGVSNS